MRRHVTRRHIIRIPLTDLCCRPFHEVVFLATAPLDPLGKNCSAPPPAAHSWCAPPQVPQDSDAGGALSRPRRRRRQYLHTHRKRHFERRLPPPTADDDDAATGPRAAVGAKVLVRWKEKWSPATGGWVPGTVVAVSDGSLPNPNGPGRVTRGWAVVRYASADDCHVHILDAEHHHDALGDREMAWRLQPAARPGRPAAAASFAGGGLGGPERVVGSVAQGRLP